jgi:hypothetical protein
MTFDLPLFNGPRPIFSLIYYYMGYGTPDQSMTPSAVIYSATNPNTMRESNTLSTMGEGRQENLVMHGILESMPKFGFDKLTDNRVVTITICAKRGICHVEISCLV